MQLFTAIPGSGFPVGFGLPKQFEAAALENVPPGLVRQTVDQYLAEGRAGKVQPGVAPLLLGPARTWKTYAACSLVRRMATFCVKFVEGPELAYRLEADAFSDGTKHYTAAMVDADFLVLDDFTVITQGTRAGSFLQ